MRFAFLSFFLFTGADSLNDGVAGCDCNRPRPQALADVPEHLAMPPAAFSLVSTERVAPLSDVPGQRAAKMRGTDLGVSFERDGQIAFLFGDSFPIDSDDDCCDDSVAVTTARNPIHYLTKKGEFLKLQTSGARLGGMEV